MIETLVIVAFIGLIPAFIASSKGRNFFLWWLYGWLLFLFAMFHSIILKPNNKALQTNSSLRKCPFCAEFIKKEAKVCRYCSKDLPSLPDENICQNCGANLDKNLRHCPKCYEPSPFD